MKQNINLLYKKINESLQQFNNLKIAEQFDFKRLYLYSIITHSTAIEGSTISEIENALMFDEGIVPSGHNVTEQLMNLDLKKAYDYVNSILDKKNDVTINMLKHLSALVMKNTGSIYNTALGTFDSSNGDIRLLNVSAGRGGKSYMNCQKVPQKLEEFCKWLNNERKKNYSDAASIYALSFEAHYKLVSIHPWVDGNGRVSRLLMNMIQMEKDLVPSIIKKEYKAKYMEALATSQDKENSYIFIEFMMNKLLDYIQDNIRDFNNSNKDTKTTNNQLHITIDGLHTALERFESDNSHGICGNWEIEQDLSSSSSLWRLSYDGRPVALCESKPKHDYIKRLNNDLSDKTFKDICKIIQAVFTECRITPDKKTKNHEKTK